MTRTRTQVNIGLFFCFLIWAIAPCQSQFRELTTNSEISVITCGAGNELYTAFGHSAFRVQDHELGIDYVYNYGTFNFNAPNFYSNFARGRMLYALSKQRFENFLYNYQLEQRWVKEQLLTLNEQQKNDLFRFLETNNLPENRDYLYDFLYDNCSTKMPDILKEVLGNSLTFNEEHLQELYTFRSLIQQNLKTNSWASFGIDLALGAKIDKTASAKDHMFLPEYVLKQLNNTSLDDKPLVTRERSILDIEHIETGYYFTTSPLFWLLMLAIFTAVITFIDYKNNTRSRFLDFIIFLVPGLIGLLIFFLWFFTDHTATELNFNILWAFPFNVVVAFFVMRNSKLPGWLYNYILALSILLGVVLLIWVLGLQRFSPLIVIVLLSLAIRYGFLIKHLRQ